MCDKYYFFDDVNEISTLILGGEPQAKFTCFTNNFFRVVAFFIFVL